MSFLLPPEVRDLFSDAYGEVFHVQLPGEEEGREFSEDLLLNQAAKPAASRRKGAVTSRKRRSDTSPSGSVTGKRRKFPSSEENETDICLRQLLSAAGEITKKFSIFHLEKLHIVLSQCIYRHQQDDDKTQLIEEMKKEIGAFLGAQ
nr:PREDICTED: ATPase family AAA domain-containing protein 2-like [Apteryx mantelli mantelli]